MRTVLVTGATGALGRAVTSCLQSMHDCRVVRSSRQPGADVLLDVRDKAQWQAAIDAVRPDLVLHLAATFGNDLDEAFAVNVESSRHLLDAVLQSQPAARVVLIGSAAEYGVVAPSENPVRTDRVLKPVSVYGMTKAWQTQLAGLYASRGADMVVARVFNLDGPHLSERLFAGRMQRQIEEVLAGRRDVLEFGSLSAIRDYVSTDDAADQLLAIAAHATSGEVHHVASGVPVAMRDLLARRLAAHGLDMAIVREAPALSNRTGYDVPAIWADVGSTMELMKRWKESSHA